MKSDNYFKVSVWSDVPPALPAFDAARVEARRKPVRAAAKANEWPLRDHVLVEQRRAYSWIFSFASKSSDQANAAFLAAEGCRDTLEAAGLEPAMSVYDPDHEGTCSAAAIGSFPESEQAHAVN